jgi:hypothetical protein
MEDTRAWILGRFKSLKARDGWHGFRSGLAKTFLANSIWFHQDEIIF